MSLLNKVVHLNHWCSICFYTVLNSVKHVMSSVMWVMYLLYNLDWGIKLVCQACRNGSKGLMIQLCLSLKAQIWHKWTGDSYLQWHDMNCGNGYVVTCCFNQTKISLHYDRLWVQKAPVQVWVITSSTALVFSCWTDSDLKYLIRVELEPKYHSASTYLFFLLPEFQPFFFLTHKVS